MSTDKEMTPRRKTRADAMQRAAQAWQLRVAGRTWQQIASTLGYSDPANVVRAVREYYGQLPQPDREELRELARARGEVLFEQALVDVLQQRPGAVRAAVAVLQRQAQLDALDRPSKIEISVTDADMRELIDDLAQQLGANSPEVDPLAEVWAEVVDDD